MIVGATRPEKINEIYRSLGDSIPIYSPGIGFQGGRVEDVDKSGTRFLIIGRSILNSSDPEVTAEKFRMAASNVHI